MSTRVETSLPVQLERMERARVARDGAPVLRETHVTLSHGGGGKSSHALIESLILPAFRNPLLDVGADAAVLAAGASPLAFTADSYVVSPLFFPAATSAGWRCTGRSTISPPPARCRSRSP